jgi:hypothetical protein
MIAQKPEHIDFAKLKQQAQTQLSNLKKLIELMQVDIARLEKVPVRPNIQDQELAYLKLEIENHRNNLEIKTKAIEEYNQRCIEMEAIRTMELNDFQANWPQVFAKALQFKTDKELPRELTSHLDEVLSLNTDKFNLDQKIDYYLALKKEVQMCQNWKDFNKKESKLITL